MSLRPYEDIDFALLKVLHALLDTRGVTAAARRLGVSQPAVSRSLAKLRAHFGDMLLIRVASGMVLTPRAEAMRRPLAEWMAEGRTLLQRTPDASGAPARTFRIASTDFGMLSVIGPAIGRIARTAPEVKIVVLPLTATADRQLNEGDLDLIVTGFPPDLETVHSRHLFEETYLSLTRSDHPGLAGGTMSAEAFAAWPHIVVAVRDEEADPISEILPDGRSRRVILWTREFSIAPYLLTSSDAIVTLPSRAAKLYAQHHPLALFAPPMELGSFPYSLTWHERSRRDPATLWLIEQLAAPFSGETSA